MYVSIYVNIICMQVGRYVSDAILCICSSLQDTVRRNDVKTKRYKHPYTVFFLNSIKPYQPIFELTS